MSRLLNMILPDIERWGALPGWAQQDKMHAMAELILEEKVERAVEIGVFGGRSLFPMLGAMRAKGSGRVYAIDAYQHQATQDGGADATYDDHDLDLYYRNLLAKIEEEKLGDYVTVLRDRSENVVDRFEDGSLDLVHVDGNHSTEASTRDVRLYLPKLKSGGYLWMDDSYWDSLQPALGLARESCVLVKDYGFHQLWRKN